MLFLHAGRPYKMRIVLDFLAMPERALRLSLPTKMKILQYTGTLIPF